MPAPPESLSDAKGNRDFAPGSARNPAAASQSNGRSGWSFAAGFVAAVAFSLLGAGVAQRLHSTPGFVIVLYGVALVGFGLSVYVHELGHLIAALLLRCPISEVAVLARPRARARVIGEVRVRLGLFGSACHVHAYPTPDASAARARLLVLYAAGAVANIGFAAAIYFAATSLVLSRPVYGSLLTVAAVSAFLGLMSLIPVTIRDRPTDGFGIVRWLLKPSGLRTALVLEDLRRRAQTPGNRWRRFEDLQDASDKRLPE